jgi:malate dehydrogenase (oxaloacetate-decarboxylating)
VGGQVDERKDRGPQDNHVIPSVDEWEVFPREAVARVELSGDELYERASRVIERPRGQIRLLVDESVVAPAPGGLAPGGCGSRISE